MPFSNHKSIFYALTLTVTDRNSFQLNTHCMYIPTHSTINQSIFSNVISQRSKDWNIIVDLGFVPLSYTFSDPDNISAFLLFQLHERVENAEMELSFEGKCVEFHLVLEKPVLQGFFPGVRSSTLKQPPVVLGNQITCFSN